MTKNQIDTLLAKGAFPEMTNERKLVETHISWVILCDRFVYKVKKPIQYSFLDFSTLALRKHFCEREIELNQRLSEGIYLEVLPINKVGDHYAIGGDKGRIIDYALKMRKLDPKKQMDVLLAKNQVSPTDIKNLAERIADFHKSTAIVYKKDVVDVREKFNALEAEKEFLREHLHIESAELVERAIRSSNRFLKKNEPLMRERLKAGYVRDCHGDLHTRNIFLLPAPQPFDCIEFNDEYRHIDVLNEVAFLCMDLDAMGRNDLSELFVQHYNSLLPAIRNENERRLFIYYKSYRANVRAKVNSLRARSATEKPAKKKALSEAGKYLRLMETYWHALDATQTKVF